MEAFLKSQHVPDASFELALNSALDAWSIGHISLQAGNENGQPARAAVVKHRQEQLATSGIEAAVLERDASTAIRYRSLFDTELRSLIHE
jgi:hypothetical protein